MKVKISVLFLFLSFCSLPSFAGVIEWTDWESATAGVSGTASGNLGGIDVSFSGNIAFAQTGSGINYWTEGTPAPYTGNAVVDNAPTAAEMIAMNAGLSTQTILFSEAVTDPIMAIVSMGQLGVPVTYDFDTAFTVLSEGRGYWGDGTYTLGADDTLTGRELHAVIQFSGTFTSLSWTTLQPEHWHGFTFGMGEQTSVPEPGSLALLLAGLFAFAGRRKFKR